MNAISQTQSIVQNLVYNMALSAMNDNTTASINQVNPSFSIQLFSNKNASAQLEFDLNNSLPTIDMTLCENTIRKKYNITKHLFIQKLTYSESLNNSTTLINDSIKNVASAGSSVSFRMFDPDNNHTEFNVTELCGNISLSVKIPLPKDSKISPILARRFQKTGVNLLNQTDSFYVNRCHIYSNESNGLQLTIRERKSLFYKNQSSSCSNGCDFGGFDINNYMICNYLKSKSISANVLSESFEVLGSLNSLEETKFRKA